MRTTHLSLVTIVAMIMITMTSMAQSNRLDSLGRVYDDIQKRAQVMQLEYDSIYRIITQCKTDEEIMIHYAEIKKLDKKAQKLGQQTNKVNREIEVEKARIEQQEREAFLAQKQAELLAKNPLPLKGEINGHQWVDMGLPSGTKWATCNVGAISPEETGDRFAWGETETKTKFNINTYKFYNAGYTKYNSTDNKTILDLSDDVANVKFAIGALTADYVADKALKGLFKGKKCVTPGFAIKCTRVLGKIIPDAFSSRFVYNIQQKKRKT